MSAAIHAQGTYLQMFINSVGSYVSIAEILSLEGPMLERDVIEVTNQLSAQGFKEYINGLKDGGDINFELSYVPGSQTHNATTGLLAMWSSGSVAQFKIQFAPNQAVEWLFSGIVTRFSISANPSEQIKASCTVKVTGNITLV